MPSNGSVTKNQFADPKKAKELMWGKDKNTYGTLEKAVYLDSLSKMTKWDLMQECTARGIIPHDDVKRMKDRLIRKFDEFVTIATRQTITHQANKLQPSEKVRQYIQQVLGA